MGAGASSAKSGGSSTKARNSVAKKVSKEGNETETPISDGNCPTVESLQKEQHKYIKSCPKTRDSSGIEEPPPEPSLLSRDQIYKPDDLVHIDRHAITAPPDLPYEPLDDVMAHLLEVAKTDLEKVRVIFRWIAAQNVNRLTNRAATHLDSPASKLIARKFTELFHQMCEKAGIIYHEIEGKVKGANFEVGQMSVRKCNSSWSAVLIDNNWYLINQAWACASGTLGERSSWKLVENLRTRSSHSRTNVLPCNDFFFLTDPVQLIHMHFPDDEQWQLLARPVSIGEFNRMAFLRHYFFDVGLTTQSHSQCRVDSDNGETEIRLGIPPENALQFSFDIFKADEDNSFYETEENDYDKYVFMEQTKNALSLKVTFPCKGTFRLRVFAKKLDTSTTKIGRNERVEFNHVCSYLLNNSLKKVGCKKLPVNERKLWGPGADTKLAGLSTILPTNGELLAQDGQARIRMKCNEQLEFKAILKSANNPKLNLFRFLLHSVEKGEVIFSMRFPEHGCYSLQISIKRKAKDAYHFQAACSFLIKSFCGHADSTPYPPLPTGRVGRAVGISEDRIFTVSHHNPIFDAAPSGELELVLRIDNVQDLDVMLRIHAEDQTEELTEYAMPSVRDREVRVSVGFPRAGWYSLRILGKEAGKKHTTLSSLFTYVIQVSSPKKDCKPFPKRERNWNSTYQLIKPRGGVFASNQNSVGFELIVPEGDLRVVAGEIQTLQKGKNGRWKGNVTIGGATKGKVVIQALQAESTSDHTDLLTYKVMSEEQLEQLDGEMLLEEEFAKQRKEDIEKRRLEQADVAKNVKADEEYDRERQERLYEEQRRERREEVNRRIKLANYHMGSRGGSAESWASGGSLAVRSGLSLNRQRSRSEHEESGEYMKQMAVDQRTNLIHSNLRCAMKVDDVEQLRRAIYDFSQHQLNDKHGLLPRANFMLQELNYKRKLQDAIAMRDSVILKEVLHEVVRTPFAKRLAVLVRQVESLLARYQRLKGLHQNVLDMDRTTMNELRNYSHPPAVLHTVMTAAFLLLGDDEETTAEWKHCQALCRTTGKESLPDLIQHLDVQTLHPEIVARAKQILEGLNLDSVRATSPGAAAFFIWTNGILDEFDALDAGRVLTPGRAGAPNPANIERQQEILSLRKQQLAGRKPRCHKSVEQIKKHDKLSRIKS